MSEQDIDGAVHPQHEQTDKHRNERNYILNIKGHNEKLNPNHKNENVK